MKSELVNSQQTTVSSKTVAYINPDSIAHGFNCGRFKSIVIGFKPKKLVSRLSWIMIALLVAPAALFAQGDTTQAHTVSMATTMRSNGKIYVVVTVLVIILLGLFFYLIRLDRKIGKLEKEQ